MNKITTLLITAMFTLATSAFAGGMVGVKYGNGDLEGNAKSYVSGTNTYAAQNGSKDNQFGAIFAEINVKESPVSIGLEYVPFDADISLDGDASGASANVGDYTTIYALAMKEINEVSLYAKLGYSMADIGTVKANDGQTTINSNSDSLEGIMMGLGIQSKSVNGIVARAEYTYTEFDEIQVTTTSNGSASVSKKADGELTTLTVSIAKSF
tara:strand:+ start:147 stop:779 length:633 start_codon:yes stop_codon:yes gene_type:complete